ncbi:biotin carboxyl carrier protein of acetyl-CoA carboxylase 1, chloroplastic-like [Impatiens glandulifera]|uniref:biotin carboxyl carrier protein of acetyl-CoA carboxylase 1, chloroplastic-like n=1 Tax=Impatiens glandulifera TaxID=253017 RepID=UPI001FB06337|nr:biotin carboxyl carrier protein of acetyl-CoA carboxylase 1, chloroplastic-like [Impatiens glandulifera]
MASSLPSTASATLAKTNSSALTAASHAHHHSPSKVSFRLSPKPKLRFSLKGLKPGWNRPCIVRAQLTEVVVDEKLATSTKDVKPSEDPSSPVLASEESISEFITQVSNLVKLVDSKDIVELQLKQLDFELLIRKKEAIPVPASSAPVMMHASPQAPPAYQMPAVPATPAAPVPRPATLALPPAPEPSKSSHPPLKSPMAGTFYRSPAPGEPPFVKVGDKVQKGQVLCIIEAMKLMNEIEADQSGTIVEVIAEDGKPVSFETPLYVIAP